MTAVLSALKERREELTKALNAKMGELDGYADAVKVDGETVEVDKDKFFAGKKVLDDANEIKGLLAQTESEMGLRTFMEAPASTPAAALDGSGFYSPQPTSGPQFKTLGQQFIESDAMTEFKQIMTQVGVSRSFKSEGRNIKQLIRAAEVKDLYTAVGGSFTAPAFGTREGPDIIPRLHRTQRVRDLFPSQTTSSNLIEYIRVSGFTNAARPVPQREDVSGNPIDPGTVGGVNFGLKPPSDLAFSTGMAPVRTIAHNIRVHKTTMDDEPRLRGIIDTEMLYGLQLAEDVQFMSGDGDGENILGFLNTPLHQVYTQKNDGATPPVPTERMSDSIRRMCTLVQLAYVEPTGVVVHPLDWEAIELERSAQGLYTIIVNAQVGAEQRLWRLPVVSTPAIPQGTALVGAFGIAAQVWDREQANIIVSTEDRDNVVRNAVTIQAEERVALEVTRPEAFVVGTLYGEPAVNSAG